MLHQRQVIWAVLIACFLALIWLLSPILLPFVAGMAIAYVLDPSVDWLERQRVPRTLGAAIMIVVFFLTILLVLLLFVPLLQGQVTELIQRLPTMLTALRDRADSLLIDIQNEIGVAPEEMRSLRDQIGDPGQALSYVAGLLGSVVAQGAAFVNIVSLVLITPVVAFYFLRDWDRLVDRIDMLLPRQHLEVAREQAREVDEILAGFVRGQALLCLSLGTFYAIGLTAVGLDFGLIIGMLAGILSFIPFVGAIVGGVASVGLALLQFDSFVSVAIVAGVFVVGQVLEGYVLQPWLVGDRVKLHPMWVIFALLAGGALFGFLGVLLAVPVMAIIGVAARFAISGYMSSSLYDHSVQDKLSGQPLPDDQAP
ncbi:AI-2E family transporter [Lacibacterium aquatile]|uniref:AI-2E family transporter n=1 Tax=Lacibacterium aquatile TaxID=1168082 RepID=A0ABW5DN34_9PROT